MKKILLFGYTLDIGGAEKVLVDIVNILNDKYEIDLALLKKQGEFFSKLPDNVNIFELRKNTLSYILFRYIPFFRKKKINKIANKKDYDVAIGFFEGRSATWVADIKKYIRKIAWVHNDVEKFNIGISDKEAKDSYSKMDKIVLVSQKAKDNFCKKYNIEESKVDVLYNLVNEKEIIEKSCEKINSENDKKFSFINVATMRKQKRQDRLIAIAKKLKDEKYDFIINIIGDGPEKENLKKLIVDYNVGDVVKLLGAKTNPYPYIKESDCFVLSSEFEGFGIAVKEALLLKKLVISTKVTGVEEMIGNNEYGIIVDNSLEALEKGMKDILDKKINTEKIIKNLDNFDSGNTEIINKLEKIIEGV